MWYLKALIRRDEKGRTQQPDSECMTATVPQRCTFPNLVNFYLQSRLSSVKILPIERWALGYPVEGTVAR
jgi:hypothetical protein